MNQLIALQNTGCKNDMRQDAELGGCGCCPVREKGKECCCPVCYKQAFWAGNAAAGCGLWCVALVLFIVGMIIDKLWWLWVLSFMLLCPISIIWGVTGCSCLVCCRERNDRVAPAVEMHAHVRGRYGGQPSAAYDGAVMAKMAPAGPPLAPQPVVYQPTVVQQPLQGAVVTGTVVQASVVGSPEEKEEA